MASGTPVDDVAAAVDEALFVEAHKHLADGPREPFIQREPRPLPVARVADRPLLIEDLISVLVHPRPHALHEPLAPEVPAGQSFFGQLTLHDVLGRDARVVHPRHPDGVVALHSSPADKHILDGVVQGVPHVQDAGHVRRRDGDDVGPLHVPGRNVEEAGRLPPPVQRCLDPIGIVSRVECLVHDQPSLKVIRGSLTEEIRKTNQSVRRRGPPTNRPNRAVPPPWCRASDAPAPPACADGSPSAPPLSPYECPCRCPAAGSR